MCHTGLVCVCVCARVCLANRKADSVIGGNAIQKYKALVRIGHLQSDVMRSDGCVSASKKTVGKEDRCPDSVSSGGCWGGAAPAESFRG